MAKKNSQSQSEKLFPEIKPELKWLRAEYHLHTFAYRDPRSAFASGSALPVVSPTTVLLGIVSTLFSIGEAEKAKQFLSVAHHCQVMIDSPEGIIFFRAFHQLRRYHTMYKGKDKKNGLNSRYGLTTINQGTREYGLVDGLMRIFVGIPDQEIEAASLALTNLRHLGTHDSLCSLSSVVETCSQPKPEQVLYLPSRDIAQSKEQAISLLAKGMTIVTLSCFKQDQPIKPTLQHWHLAGGDDTEHVAYAIQGYFRGTTKGKVYYKRKS